MSDLKMCDLCDFVYDVFDVASNHQNYVDYEGNLIFTKLNDSKTVFHVDVCPNCFNEFYEGVDAVIEKMKKKRKQKI